MNMIRRKERIARRLADIEVQFEGCGDWWCSGDDQERRGESCKEYAERAGYS